MATKLQHFIYGTPARLKRFRASLPDGVEVQKATRGLVVVETLASATEIDVAINLIEELAQAEGVEYEGHGQDFDLTHTEPRLELQSRRFADRTGIRAGHGFAIPLPDGRCGHAVYLGSDRQGYLLLDISTLVTDRPVTPDALQDAPRRYRQPILVWHTDFSILPIASKTPLAQLPRAVVFRSSVGWPDPDECERLETRFTISRTDTPEGWNALLVAMAKAGERLPGITGFNLCTAQVGRTGVLKLIMDYELVQIGGHDYLPMPWLPARMSEVVSALVTESDIIAARDSVV